MRDTKELIGTDTSKPEVPVVNALSDKDTAISGTAEANAVVTAKVDEQVIGSATANAEGNFTIEVTKQIAGTKVLVIATDYAGNVSESAVVTVIDVTAPEAPIVNAVNDNDIVINGTAEVGATVTAEVNGEKIGEATANTVGQFTINIAKQVLATTINVHATDSSGNKSNDTQVTVTDEVVTGVSVSYTLQGDHAFKNLYQFSAASEGSRFAVYRFLLQNEKGDVTLLQNYGTDSTVSWTPKMPGTYKIIVQAKDYFNNGFSTSYKEAETEMTFKVDPSMKK